MRDKKRQPQPVDDPQTLSASQVGISQSVLLLVDHTHAGVPYLAGDRIRIGPSDRTWLREQSVIES